MAHVAPIYPNFARGEVSPLMFGRIDIEQYPSCLDKCRNAYIRPYGCVTRLSGTEFISSTKNLGKVRLLKFVFSPTDSYIIECGAGYFRFYQNGAPILNNNNEIYEITNDYYEDQLDSIRYVQLDDIIKLTCLPHCNDKTSTAWVTATAYSVDDLVTENNVVYFCKTAHTSGTFATDLTNGYWEAQNSTAHPKELIRNASDDWTFKKVDFKETPYLDQNTTNITLKPFAVTGNSITIEASSAYFNANMVGANFWIGTKVTDAETNKDVQGYVKITNYTDSTHVTASVESKLSGTTATKLWGEGAFSDYRGYPSVVALFDGRLYYARTPYQPRNVYGSKPYAYETFTPAIDNEDDAGINVALATNANGDGSDIKWLVGASYLLCGTYGGEFVIRGIGDGAITPTDISARQRTNWGGEPVQPIVAGTFVHFLQRNGNKLRQFQYDYYYDAYKAVDVSIFSEHLLESPIKEMALQKNPDSIIYLMREDGKVVMLTLEQDQSVQAWSLLEELGAEVESIQTIPSYEGNYDEVYMVMKRQTLQTTSSAVCSNPDVTVINNYTGTKETAGYITEVLECSEATRYVIDNNILTAYSTITYDDTTGISNGVFTVSEVTSGQPNYESTIYITTGNDIQTRQDVLSFKSRSGPNSILYIDGGIINFPASTSTLSIEANTTYKIHTFFPSLTFSRIRVYKVENDTETLLTTVNLHHRVYITMIGGNTNAESIFTGTINLTKSTVMDKTLANANQVIISASTGEVINLADYDLEIIGNLEIGDTITVTYNTSFSTPVRYIERMQNPITPENKKDWWYVRSGLKYDGYAITKGNNLTLSANSGTVTATADSNIFEENKVGNRIRFIDDDYNVLGEGTITEVTSDTVITLDVITEFQTISLTGGKWGISTDVVSDLDHLDGREVQIYADGKEQAKKTVLDGSIEIEDAFIAVVGLPYTSYITTMPMEAGSQNGTAVGKRKRISEMAIRVWNTIGARVGRDLNNLYDTIYEQTEPFTGVIPNIKYNQGWVWDANITVEQSHPFPMNILSIAPIVTEVDK